MRLCRMDVAATLAALLATGPASAQEGRADLRYVAPLPASVLFATIDSIHNVMSGLPMGEIATTGTLQSVSELRFAPADDAVVVTAVLKQLQGEMTTPMGSMPLTAGEGEPLELRIGQKGPSPEQVGGDIAGPALGVSPSDLLGSARAVTGLIAVAGRELRLNETWVDTTRSSPAVDGLEVEVTAVTRGTYAADSVFDGRPVNVLRITTDVAVKASGTTQGRQIAQEMTTTVEETVLWDSARHILLFRDAVAEMRSTTEMAQQGVTMTMTGRTRTITTAQPGNE